MVGLKNNTINPSGVNLDNLSEVIRHNVSTKGRFYAQIRVLYMYYFIRVKRVASMYICSSSNNVILSHYEFNVNVLNSQLTCKTFSVELFVNDRVNSEIY